MIFLKIASICAVLAIFIFACNQTPTGNNTAQNSADKPANNTAENSSNVFSDMPVNIPPEVKKNDASSGGKIFMEICAKCHKEDGSGGKVTIEGETINAENLTGEKMINMADAKYVDYIENGVPDEGMPAFKGRLSDEEIRSVIKFIRTEIQKK